MQNGLTPDYLTQLVPNPVGQASSYNLRNANNLQTIHAASQLYYKSFLPSVVRDWNTLPSSTRTLPTVESFKRSLNTYTYRKPSFYYSGERFGQIQHARLRTNCSPLKYYLYHKNIIEDPRCDCGQVETNNHFLLECNRYNIIRTDLLNEVSQYCNPTLHSLLFGDIALNDEANESIFKAVHRFIIRSKRFWTYCITTRLGILTPVSQHQTLNMYILSDSRNMLKPLYKIAQAIIAYDMFCAILNDDVQWGPLWTHKLWYLLPQWLLCIVLLLFTIILIIITFIVIHYFCLSLPIQLNAYKHVLTCNLRVQIAGIVFVDDIPFYIF